VTRKLERKTARIYTKNKCVPDESEIADTVVVRIAESELRTLMYHLKFRLHGFKRICCKMSGRDFMQSPVQRQVEAKESV
jgi:hypothetical protein